MCSCFRGSQLIHEYNTIFYTVQKSSTDFASLTINLYTSCIRTAGHYVPATAQVIVESNSIYSQNLKGIGIGNGWVDPVVQYNAYAKVSSVYVLCAHCTVHAMFEGYRSKLALSPGSFHFENWEEPGDEARIK